MSYLIELLVSGTVLIILSTGIGILKITNPNYKVKILTEPDKISGEHNIAQSLAVKIENRGFGIGKITGIETELRLDGFYGNNPSVEIDKENLGRIFPYQSRKCTLNLKEKYMKNVSKINIAITDEKSGE